ncbi:hypothetical protein DFJ65_1039 [Calidifontibacter indicus]|uniref:Uncharacterized protein n=1 Tax=Calidifontibacter indicus TaxID=419650 RepID=A0A3D9UL33_9MICO|nr:hypothetical protein DFJ65_1039 [Calidifontibacter indicus]
MTPPPKATFTMTSDVIRVRGARTHNLRHIDVDIPKKQLTVVTGLPAWLPAPTVTGAGSRGRSGDRGAFQLDHLAGDRQPCHAEHGGGRRYLGCSQPRRQHSVVLEEQVDVGGVHVEPHEVGQ